MSRPEMDFQGLVVEGPVLELPLGCSFQRVVDLRKKG
jgi:hypothetical protein